MDYQNIFKAGTGQSVAEMYSNFQGAFAELVQLYKSTTEPNLTYARMWWADETTGLLKQRNVDNTAWIVRGYLDKPFFGLVPYTDNGGSISPLLAGRNRLINGNFDPSIGWQRGTSFTLNSAETKFTADRYRCTQGTGGVGTVSMQAVTPAAVPGARGSLRWQQTAAASTAPEIMQPVEHADTFSGTVCTRGFWAKADAQRTIQVTLRQNFGTGGNPSASVDIAAQSFTIGTVWQFVQATFIVPDTSTKIFGSDGNSYLGARIILPVGVTFDIQFTLDQLELGNVATGFEWRQPREQLADEQRYFEKSYDPEVAPGTNTARGASRVSGQADSSGFLNSDSIQFIVEKRVIPTITAYSVAGTLGKTLWMVNGGSWQEVAINISNYASTKYCSLNNSSVGVGQHASYQQHWTADAEFYN